MSDDIAFAHLTVLRAAGLKVNVATLPNHEYADLATLILNAEMGAEHEAFISSPRVDLLLNPAQIEGLRASLKLPAGELANARVKRERAVFDLLKLFEKFDVLVSPTLLVEAPSLDTKS